MATKKVTFNIEGMQLGVVLEDALRTHGSQREQSSLLSSTGKLLKSNIIAFQLLPLPSPQCIHLLLINIIKQNYGNKKSNV